MSTTNRPPPKEAASGEVAQSSHRIKDKRLRRAFGILDTLCCLCLWVVKGCKATHVNPEFPHLVWAAPKVPFP